MAAVTDHSFQQDLSEQKKCFCSFLNPLDYILYEGFITYVEKQKKTCCDNRIIFVCCVINSEERRANLLV